MTAPAWMPLYVADYLADTGHLTMAEHGAYMLLIMHYWQNGGLPNDEKKLARICRATPKEWSAIRDTIAGLFSPGWRHKRIDEEVAKAAETIDKRRVAGRIAGLASAASRQRNVQRSLDDGANEHPTIDLRSSTPSPPPSPSAPNGAAPGDPETELFRRGREILGKEAGSLIAKLLKAKGGKAPLARAALETASTKENPREYLGAIVRNKDPPPGEAVVKVGL